MNCSISPRTLFIIVTLCALSTLVGACAAFASGGTKGLLIVVQATCAIGAVIAPGLSSRRHSLSGRPE